MAFFDELQSKTQSLISSADTKIDIAKLNIKINDETNRLTQSKTMLGELAWQDIEAGAFAPTEAMETVCRDIRASLVKIAEMEAQVSELRTGPKVAAAMRSACEQCGAALDEDMKFCPRCGKAR